MKSNFSCRVIWIWGQLGASCFNFGASLVQLGAKWGQLSTTYTKGTVLAPENAQTWDTIRISGIKKLYRDIQKSKFSCRAIWIWGQFGASCCFNYGASQGQLGASWGPVGGQSGPHCFCLINKNMFMLVLNTPKKPMIFLISVRSSKRWSGYKFEI